MWDLGCRVGLRRKESSTCLLLGTLGGERRGWDLGGKGVGLENRMEDWRGGGICSVYVI